MNGSHLFKESIFQKIWSYNEYNRRRWIAEQAGAVQADQKVLDAGAGRGRYRRYFAHCKYYTQDFGKEIGTIGEYIPLDYESDITEIPVPDESFDVILCTEVFEHIPDPVKALHEFQRILRPGGCLFLSAPLAGYLHQEPYCFYGGFTPYWYRTFLPQAGFEIRSIESNAGFFSLFGQEGIKYSAYIDPRRTLKWGWLNWVFLSVLWLVTLPFLRILFPLIGFVLDQSPHSPKGATAGYHVVAARRPEEESPEDRLKTDSTERHVQR